VIEFFDPEIWSFIEFGLIANFVSIVCTFLITIFKVSSLGDQDLRQVMLFSAMRQEYIKTYNSSAKIYFVFALNFVPMYTTVLNAWYIFNMLLIPGAKGVITATVNSDRLALFSLVRYDIKKF
jgi:hypothetical protein